MRSKTYADDGMMADASSNIKNSMRRYCEAPIGLLGKQSVEDELKLVSWQDKLLGIGWELDFKAWTVKPGPRARKKLLWR